MSGNETNDPGSEPSFGDPRDPRWSQQPKTAPPRNPYLDMPLDAPPIAGDRRTSGPGYAGQGGNNGHQAAQRPGYPQQQQQGYPGPAPQPSGVLSIVSLVAGIIGIVSGGLLLVPEIVAIICGHMALKREPHMRGVAIAGLVTGYLGLLFLVLVAGLLILGFFAVLGTY